MPEIVEAHFWHPFRMRASANSDSGGLRCASTPRRLSAITSWSNARSIA